MHRTKTFNKIIDIIGKELYEKAEMTNRPKTKIGINPDCYILSEFTEERRNYDGTTYKVNTAMFLDGASVMYISNGCAYSYGSISKLIEVLDDIDHHSPASDALRAYYNAYSDMKKIAKEEE